MRIRRTLQRAAFLGATSAALSCAEVEVASPEALPDEAEQMRQKLAKDKGDLDFILKQIQIAEEHAAGAPLQSLVSDPILPFGLRTVDGAFNNIVPGQERFGAADRAFRRALPPVFRPAEGAAFDPDGPGPLTVGSPTSYSQTSGLVFDAQPRIISNLISDQTSHNPAAAAVAERTDGSGTNVDGKGTFFIPNVAPDVGLSAPYNSWFTFFGQFFDHGLDLVNKGGSGTVFVPLQPDDPLFVPGSRTNFMVLTRATNQPGPDGVLGTPDDVREHHNKTTPFVDQNQTYTSHPSHQVFLREYTLNADGRPVSTGRLLDGARGGLASWAEVKAQARSMLGINLTDADVTNLPLLATDPYGRFLRGPSGFAQLVTSSGLVEGNPASPISTSGATRTGHAFLDDIAHRAAPSPGLVADSDSVVNTGPQPTGTYDNELLDAHFITGDGRGNENIALTAVHTIFHAEHNRLVEHVKQVVLATANPTYIAQWLTPGANQADGIQPLEWNGERLFQAARFGTEMQYQHLVFEEFARKVQPEVNVFAGYDTSIDPAIMAEFAHVVYRFGHSMLTETVARTNPDGTPNDIGLIEAFLNPLAFSASGATDKEAAGAIIRGLTRQVGNEIDEFVTDALRNNLLGVPLDLATINLARGRDTGVPPLNEARRLFFGDTGNSALRPYESWRDFGFGLRNPESLVNFVAAYGTHPSITSARTTADKRAAAMAIVLGSPGAPPDSVDFLNSTGAWSTRETGLNQVDFWIGGLAEKPMVFGGLLGSSFNFVFETQMERLQDGDRFYYLTRTASLNMFTQLEENSFTEMVMRNTDVRHLPMDIFSRPAFAFELGNLGTSGAVPDDPNTPDQNEAELLVRMRDGTIRYTGPEHVVMGGTPGSDRMRSSEGDDTLWGDEGNDWMEGGDGNDALNGGDGDDIITDLNGIDNIKGGSGNDVISAGPGLGDLILGGLGHDYIVAGADPKETFGGQGNDYIVAGDSSDTVFGGEGDDWIEGGDQADLLQGDNGDPFQQSPVIGHDVVIGGGGNDDYDMETGDDIMVSDSGIERHEGMLGFDWVTYRSMPRRVDADLSRTGLLPPNVEDLRDRFDLVEGLSGSAFDDLLTGDDATAAELTPLDAVAGQNNALNNLTQIARISGLQTLLGTGTTSFTGGNILLGGPGSDLVRGAGGDDLIDGDAWLQVRLSVRDASGAEIGTADTMGGVLRNKAGVLASTPATYTLNQAMFEGRVNPGQLRIVREILFPAGGGAVDTAVFSEVLANYDVTRDADGSVRVIHARGSQDDGTDRLRNIERLQFADGTIAASSVTTPSDTTPPEPVSAATATPGDTQVALSWTNPPDAAVVRVLRSTESFATSAGDTANQTILFEGLATSFTDAQVTSGITYFYTLFARDAAGNFSAPATTSASLGIPQLLGLRVNEGAATTRDRTLRVQITGRGGSADGLFALIATSEPGLETANPVRLTPTILFAVPPEEGTKNVCVRLVDRNGNRSANHLCTSIILEAAPADPAPTVSFTRPTNGARFTPGSVVPLRASASDNVRVMAVEFHVNGVLLRRDTTAPIWRAEWTATSGTHTFTAIAEDNLGQRTSTSITVCVGTAAACAGTTPAPSSPAPSSPAPSDDTPPEVSFTRPTDGARFTPGSVVDLRASASDNVRVVAVEFRVDGELVRRDTTAPIWRADWTATSGTHTLTATAVDDRGQTSSTSITVCVGTAAACGGTVPASAPASSSPPPAAPSGDTPPEVRFTRPTEGASFSAGTVVALRASASDNARVVAVEFHVDGVLLRRDTTAPIWKAEWTATRGTHTLTAIAEDDTGQRTTTNIEVTVP